MSVLKQNNDDDTKQIQAVRAETPRDDDDLLESVYAYVKEINKQQTKMQERINKLRAFKKETKGRVRNTVDEKNERAHVLKQNVLLEKKDMCTTQTNSFFSY
jgi:hypothetical protein